MKFISGILRREFHSTLLAGVIPVVLFWATFAPGASAADSSAFYLKPGDRVCFYGDSITEQRFYGVDVETYVRTRFPGPASEVCQLRRRRGQGHRRLGRAD